jgi:hypothetical protein
VSGKKTVYGLRLASRRLNGLKVHYHAFSGYPQKNRRVIFPKFQIPHMRKNWVVAQNRADFPGRTIASITNK